MKRFLTVFGTVAVLSACCINAPERSSIPTGEQLMYHEIRVDTAGNIVPWFSDDPATAYDDVLGRIWNFWDNMKTDYNGLPYYMNHLAWIENGYIDRGIGGDQIAMLLSSWNLLYMYTGNIRIRENMQFMAGYYLAHSLSPAGCRWPNLPFPQNTNIYSGEYDGDMILGPGYLQPDKAGSFGLELLKLSQITIREPQRGVYLKAAVDIANTLAANIRQGNADRSPWPFKVNAFTGEVGQLRDAQYKNFLGYSDYTTNYAPTLELFMGLCELGEGNTAQYRTATAKVIEWMNEYPVRNGKWGPFFEDVPGWSDTQINAVTWAQFLMNHPETDKYWKEHVRLILDWVYEKLSNDSWAGYGVTAINEQTAYKVPGNSHTSRQASAEIQYWSLTGDDTYLQSAIRQLNWATYMVSDEGWNRYPQDDIWITDGYGDYVRHYLRSMAFNPNLAPAGSHILSSSTGIKLVEYADGEDFFNIYYEGARESGEEVIRLSGKPESVTFAKDDGKVEIPEGNREGGIPAFWEWFDCENGGGFIVVYRYEAGTIEVFGRP